MSVSQWIRTVGGVVLQRAVLESQDPLSRRSVSAAGRPSAACRATNSTSQLAEERAAGVAGLFDAVDAEQQPVAGLQSLLADLQGAVRAVGS